MGININFCSRGIQYINCLVLLLNFTEGGTIAWPPLIPSGWSLLLEFPPPPPPHKHRYIWEYNYKLN